MDLLPSSLRFRQPEAIAELWLRCQGLKSSCQHRRESAGLAQRLFGERLAAAESFQAVRILPVLATLTSELSLVLSAVGLVVRFAAGPAEELVAEQTAAAAGPAEGLVAEQTAAAAGLAEGLVAEQTAAAAGLAEELVAEQTVVVVKPLERASAALAAECRTIVAAVFATAGFVLLDATESVVGDYRSVEHDYSLVVRSYSLAARSCTMAKNSHIRLIQQSTNVSSCENGCLNCIRRQRHLCWRKQPELKL